MGINISSVLTSTKFVKATSLILLEEKMEELILRSGKHYDFYNIFFDGKFYIAAYREEIRFNILPRIKK